MTTFTRSTVLTALWESMEIFLKFNKLIRSQTLSCLNRNMVFCFLQGSDVNRFPMQEQIH